jgi:hypothetical protein
MTVFRPVSGQSHLSVHQQLTQHLADQFNADERLWANLGPLRRLRRLLHPAMSQRKRKKLDLADFARAQPPKDCIGIWMIAVRDPARLN